MHFSLNLSLHFGQATTLLFIGVPLGKLIPFSGPNSNPYFSTYITSIRKPYAVCCPVFQLIMMKPRHSKSRAHTLITMLYCFSIMRLHIHHILEETHKIMEKSYNPICSNISGKKKTYSKHKFLGKCTLCYLVDNKYHLLSYYYNYKHNYQKVLPFWKSIFRANFKKSSKVDEVLHCFLFPVFFPRISSSIASLGHESPYSTFHQLKPLQLKCPLQTLAKPLR